MDDANQGMEASAATIRDRVRRQNAITLNNEQAIYTENLRPSNQACVIFNQLVRFFRRKGGDARIGNPRALSELDLFERRHAPQYLQAAVGDPGLAGVIGSSARTSRRYAR